MGYSLKDAISDMWCYLNQDPVQAPVLREYLSIVEKKIAEEDATAAPNVRERVNAFVTVWPASAKLPPSEVIGAIVGATADQVLEIMTQAAEDEQTREADAIG